MNIIESPHTHANRISQLSNLFYTIRTDPIHMEDNETDKKRWKSENMKKKKKLQKKSPVISIEFIAITAE